MSKGDKIILFVTTLTLICMLHHVIKKAGQEKQENTPEPWFYVVTVSDEIY